MKDQSNAPGNAELIAIANRRREELKKAQDAQKPSAPAPTPRREESLMHTRSSSGSESESGGRGTKKTARNASKPRDKVKKPARKPRERKEETNARKQESRTDELIARLSALRENYRGALKNALGYFIIFLCVLLIICTISASVFLFGLLGYGKKAETPSTVLFSAEGQKKLRYDYSDIVRDGVCYIDLNTIAELCSLSVSGDNELIIYSTRCGEQIRFAPPSRTVVINGISVTADANILSEGKRLWVPLTLINDYFSGIDIVIDAGTDEGSGKPYMNITAARIKEENGYAEVAFVLKHNSTLSGIANESLPEEPITLPIGAPSYDYAADLSRYLRFMCPEDRNKHMLLINPSNPADAAYIPEDMITVPNPRYDNGASLCRDASMSLEALFLEMHTLGFRDMKVSVAYRSYEQQEHQFNIYTYNERYYYRSHYETEGKWFSDAAYAVLGKTYLEEKYIAAGRTSLSADDAKRVAMSYSAYPGTGDHQTGLAADLYLPGHTGAAFADTEEYKWLCDNAHKFGFIIRYPEDKENITGYAFEPYHLRFVGQYHAALIFETGLSLEEYVAKYID